MKDGIFYPLAYQIFTWVFITLVDTTVPSPLPCKATSGIFLHSSLGRDSLSNVCLCGEDLFKSQVHDHDTMSIWLRHGIIVVIASVTSSSSSSPHHHCYKGNLVHRIHCLYQSCQVVCQGHGKSRNIPLLTCVSCIGMMSAMSRRRLPYRRNLAMALLPLSLYSSRKSIPTKDDNALSLPPLVPSSSPPFLHTQSWGGYGHIPSISLLLVARTTRNWPLVMTWFDDIKTSFWEPQNLRKLVWVLLCRAATICPRTAYQCAQTLRICWGWMQEAVWGICQPQPWRNDIIMTPHVTHNPQIWEK